jgi:hypothetical protein
MTRPAWDTRPVEVLRPVPTTSLTRLRDTMARAGRPAVVLAVLVMVDTVLDVLMLTGLA